VRDRRESADETARGRGRGATSCRIVAPSATIRHLAAADQPALFLSGRNDAR
jgi:hypothetical protein